MTTARDGGWLLLPTWGQWTLLHGRDRGGQSNGLFQGPLAPYVLALPGGGHSLGFSSGTKLPIAAPPIIANLTPNMSSTITSTTAISFDVLAGAGGSLQILAVEVDLSSGKKELVWLNDHTGDKYAGSSVASVTGGYHVSVTRTPSWPTSGLVLRIYATDPQGTLATAYSYTVSNPDTQAPVFDQFNPAPGGTVTVAGAVAFRALDAGGLTPTLTGWPIVEYLRPDGMTETVYDGTSFQAPFATSSTRGGSNLGNFSIVRDGGWFPPEGALQIIATDPVGNSIDELYEFLVATPPVIANFSPTSGSTITRTTPILFQVTDLGGAIETVGLRLIGYTYFGTGPAEVIFDIGQSVGGGFVNPYITSSTLTGISGGAQFSILRDGGWPATVTLRIYVVDIYGNEALEQGYTLTCTDPLPGPDTTPPVVGAVSPAPGTAISPTQPVTFQVTDDSGVFRRIVVNATYPTGVVECVHDGDGFRGFYSLNSTRVAITQGFAYSLLRAGGWPGSPTITVFAIDAAGNEAIG
jgi:hypothetical protein